MKPLIISLLSGLVISISLSAQTDTTHQDEVTIHFPPKKINNPFYNLNNSAKEASFTIRNTAINAIYPAPGSDNIYRPGPYRPEDLPVWKELMTLASHLAISAFAEKRNLYYVSPR